MVHRVMLYQQCHGIVPQGYHYDDADGGLYFNGKTGMLDDVYGDYYFATPQEHSSCKLDPQGKVILDGEGTADLTVRIMDWCLCYWRQTRLAGGTTGKCMPHFTSDKSPWEQVGITMPVTATGPSVDRTNARPRKPIGRPPSRSPFRTRRCLQENVRHPDHGGEQAGAAHVGRRRRRLQGVDLRERPPGLHAAAQPGRR